MASLSMSFAFPIRFRPSSDPADYPLDLSRSFETPPLSHAVRGADGIPRMDYGRIPIRAGLGLQENPALVAWDALALLQRGDPEGFRRGAAWLADRATPAPGGRGVCWTVGYPWTESGIRLEPPWPYGLAQGLASSVLVRAWRLGMGEKYRELALAAAPRFGSPLEEGGVLSRTPLGVFPEMYPVSPAQRVLDGHGFLLQGLRDLASLGHEGSRALAEETLDSLARRILDWDHRGFWSTYGVGRQLASGFYHALNHAWVSAFASWRPESADLARLARDWAPSRLTWSRRARVYGTFKGRAVLALLGGQG